MPSASRKILLCAQLAVAIGLAGCVSSEGEVFQTTTASAAPICARDPFVIRNVSGATSVWGAATGNGTQAFAVSQFNDDIVLDEMTFATDTMPVQVRPAGITTGGYAYFASIATGAQNAWVVLQNHSLAGRWHVYASTFDASVGGLTGSLLRLSDESATENIGPKAAWLGARMGVAFRADSRLAFSVTDGSTILSTVKGPALLPHPTITRVLTRTAGYVVVYKRANASLAYFNSAGAEAGGVELGAPFADATVVNDRVVAFSAQGGALSRVVFASDGTPMSRPASALSANAITGIAAASQKSYAAVAFVEGTANNGSTLRFLWSDDGKELSASSLVVDTVQSLDVVPIDAGALVIYLTPTAIMGRIYCAPPGQ